MSYSPPPFNELAYCEKIIQSKQEYKTLRRLSILSLQAGIENMPEQNPNKKRDIAELQAQINHFKDELDGVELDIQNCIRYIEENKLPYESK